MRQYLATVFFALALAIASAEMRRIVRQPIPIVQVCEAPPPLLRRRPLKRRYAPLV